MVQHFDTMGNAPLGYWFAEVTLVYNTDLTWQVHVWLYMSVYASITSYYTCTYFFVAIVTLDLWFVRNVGL